MKQSRGQLTALFTNIPTFYNGLTISPTVYNCFGMFLQLVYLSLSLDIELAPGADYKGDKVPCGNNHNNKNLLSTLFYYHLITLLPIELIHIYVPLSF